MNPLHLIILALIGLAISFYIYSSKRSGKHLFCPNKQDCDAVVRSKYGKIFGFENTIFGMLFYILIIIYDVSLQANQNLFKGDIIYYSIVGISFISVVFSAYLTFVQAFILKKWCYYCIISSISSVLILWVVIF
jgi:uncharacterized membrane protein|tara:strand:+ start:5410 stop:5811 length:402 start_codon:yes stop_codon:yes gene_type:complete